MSESGTSYNDETIQQLLDQLEPMQTEIEQLMQERDDLKKRLKELESQKQMLSSENSKYRSELQKMADKIVRLNESDKILHDNNRLQAEIQATKQQADQRVRKVMDETEAVKKKAKQDSHAALLAKKSAEKKEANWEKIIQQRVQTEKEAFQEKADKALRKQREKLDQEYRTDFILAGAFSFSACIYLIFTSKTLLWVPNGVLQLFYDIGTLISVVIIEPTLQVGRSFHNGVLDGLFVSLLVVGVWGMCLWLLYQLKVVLEDFCEIASEKQHNGLAVGTILLSSMILSLTYYEAHGTPWPYMRCWGVGFMAMLLLYYWKATFTAIGKLAERIVEGISNILDQFRG